MKLDRRSTTGSDCRPRAVVVLSLLVQLLMSLNVRSSDVAAVHLPLKQTLAGACSTDGCICYG